MLKILGRLFYRFFNVEVRYKGNWQKDNKWLINKGFKTIIDIGANEGQFALKMRKFFPDTKIISFEPIPEVFDQLKAKFAGDPNFVAYCLGVGEKKDTATFYVNESSASSSFLKMKDHTSHFNNATEEKPVSIQIDTLDHILATQQLIKPLLVKIDVQGFEDKVITGGLEVLKNADMVLTEVSYFNLYEGQKLFNDIYKQLTSIGFFYHGNYEQLYSPVDNSVLQSDAIFIKAN